MGAEKIEWVDGVGGEIITLVPSIGMKGFHGPPPKRRSESRFPGVPGAWLDAKPQHEPRDMFASVLISAPSRSGRQDLIRQMARAFDNHEGARLRFTDCSGLVRECRQVELIDGFDGLVDMAPTWVIPGLHFRALDPYWYETTATEVDVTLSLESAASTSDGTAFGDPNTGFGDPIPFGGVAGGSTVSGVVTFNALNQADVAASPIWTLEGPFNLVEVTNLRTGEVWTYDGTVETGETLVVDCRFGVRSVELDGENAYRELARTELWHLLPGSQDVRVRMLTTGPTTKVGLAWTPKWLTL